VNELSCLYVYKPVKQVLIRSLRIMK
jgi:hypothetical protein